MNKGTFGFPQLIRDESFHGFPKQRMTSESFYGFPSGREDFDFKLNVTAPDQVKTITLAALDCRLSVDWGDGIVENYYGNAASVYITHIYKRIGVYNCLFNGETTKITSIAVTSLVGLFSDGQKFRNVEFFDIRFNSLLVQQFPDISTWINLKSLQFGQCGFYGIFPNLSHCSELYTVDCGFSNFTGPLPSFSNNLKLKTFNGRSCGCSGELPSFNNCIDLEYFYIYSNKFNGILPSFSNCIKLYLFDISFNTFSGLLPSFLTNTLLQTILVNNNQFSGIMPSVNGLLSLITYDCSVNQFTGTIPSFSLCTSLQTFNAGGPLNAWMGTMPYFPSSLRTFNFTQSNSAILEFPYDIFDNLVNLVTINIVKMQITGTRTFPNISNNINLSTLYITDNDNSEIYKFNNGTINFNTSKLVWFFARNMDGVSLDFTNLQMPINSLFFINIAASQGNMIYPLGSKIIGGATSYGGTAFNFQIGDSGLSQANIDATLINLFQGRNNFSNADGNGNKYIFAQGAGVNGVANSAPTGIYQQPTYFTHDLTEAQIDTLATTVKEKIWILVNCQVSIANTTKRYKWTITTN